MNPRTQSLMLASVALFGFMILFSGFLYLSFKYPILFQKEIPTVLIINIDGEILSSEFYGILEKRGQNRTEGITSTNVIRMFEDFSQDESIKAFILEINSSGGQTSGQEEIARYIKRMDKPVIAVITENALSSGYYVAASTDKIYADKSAKIGKMGEVFVYVNRNRVGKEQVCHITSANYKEITLEDCWGFEPNVFEGLRTLVNLTHTILISHIAKMRNMPISDIENLADNRILTSEQALELGLIDEIGTTNDAVNWLESELNTSLSILYLRDMLPTNQK